MTLARARRPMDALTSAPTVIQITTNSQECGSVSEGRFGVRAAVLWAAALLGAMGADPVKAQERPPRWAPPPMMPPPPPMAPPPPLDPPPRPAPRAMTPPPRTALAMPAAPAAVDPSAPACSGTRIGTLCFSPVSKKTFQLGELDEYCVIYTGALYVLHSADTIYEVSFNQGPQLGGFATPIPKNPRPLPTPQRQSRRDRTRPRWPVTSP